MWGRAFRISIGATLLSLALVGMAAAQAEDVEPFKLADTQLEDLSAEGSVRSAVDLDPGVVHRCLTCFASTLTCATTCAFVRPWRDKAACWVWKDRGA